MRSVQLHGKGDIRFADVPPPGGLKQGEVRVRVEAAGICGSDIHNFRTGQWISRSPSIPGHEFSGTVTEIAPGAEHLAVGDLVIADSRYWCGTCEACATGRPHLCASLGFVGEVCDGGFAEEAVLPARLLFKAGEGVSAPVAATAEPLAVALHAVARLAPVRGEAILVIGCGMIGALTALVLARKGFGPVRVADRNISRAELVADVTGAIAVGVDQAGLAGVAGIVEATGSASLLHALVQQAPGGTRIGLVGIFHDRIDIDPNWLVEREISLIGCHAFKDELSEAVGRLGDYGGAIAQFLSEPIRLEEVPETYDRIMAGDMKAPKTIIRP